MIIGADQQGDAEQDAERDARRRAQQALVDRILDQERAGQRHAGAAQPDEAARAQPLLEPARRRLGGRAQSCGMGRFGCGSSDGTGGSVSAAKSGSGSNRRRREGSAGASDNGGVAGAGRLRRHRLPHRAEAAAGDGRRCRHRAAAAAHARSRSISRCSASRRVECRDGQAPERPGSERSPRGERSDLLACPQDTASPAPRRQGNSGLQDGPTAAS